MFLEFMALVVIVVVLGTKWVTTRHKTALRQRLIAAEVLRTRNEQRLKLYKQEREAAEVEEKGILRDTQIAQEHLEQLKLKLSDQEERNRDLQDQIEDV